MLELVLLGELAICSLLMRLQRGTVSHGLLREYRKPNLEKVSAILVVSLWLIDILQGSFLLTVVTEILLLF